MNRKQLLLAALASSRGRPFTPVQLQKAMFLITQNAAGLVDDGPNFDFVPYDYGPFDKSVYEEASALSTQGLAEIAVAPSGRWNTYAASEWGVQQGAAILASLTPEARSYVEQVTDWVRKQSFSSLVKSIYDAYPEMRANSIFQG